MRPLQINQNLNYEKIYLFHFDIANIMIVFFMCKYFLCFFNIVSETIFLYHHLFTPYNNREKNRVKIALT